MWLVIFAAALGLTGAAVVYMIAAVGKFGLIKKLSKEKKWARILLSAAVIAVLFAAAALVFSPINAVVIFLYVLLFFLLSDALMRGVGRITRKTFRYYWQGWLAIAVSVLHFAAGYYLCMNVWQKNYTLETEKEVGTLRIAMFADSHLGTTFDGDSFAKYMQDIEAQNPDILLIAGDYVDDWSEKKDMEAACRALGALNVKYGVWFAYGNHDQGFFDDRDFTAEELEEALKENGIGLLEDTCCLIDDRFYIAGRRDRSLGQRKTMEELLAGTDPEKYIIVLDHEPNAYEEEADSAADLVLSGHTHGGQLFPIGLIAELLGINDRSYGYESRKGTEFIVTSGISDWELYFKTGTKSEYVIIDLTEKE